VNLARAALDISSACSPFAGTRRPSAGKPQGQGDLVIFRENRGYLRRHRFSGPHPGERSVCWIFWNEFPKYNSTILFVA